MQRKKKTKQNERSYSSCMLKICDDNIGNALKQKYVHEESAASVGKYCWYSGVCVSVYRRQSPSLSHTHTHTSSWYGTDEVFPLTRRTSVFDYFSFSLFSLFTVSNTIARAFGHILVNVGPKKTLCSKKTAARVVWLFNYTLSLVLELNIGRVIVCETDEIANERPLWMRQRCK